MRPSVVVEGITAVAMGLPHQCPTTLAVCPNHQAALGAVRAVQAVLAAVILQDQLVAYLKEIC